MKITVVGFYESTGRLFADQVDKEDCCAAVAAVALIRAIEGQPNPDVCIVAVLEGHPEVLDDAESVSSIVDWPGVAETPVHQS